MTEPNCDAAQSVYTNHFDTIRFNCHAFRRTYILRNYKYLRLTLRITIITCMIATYAF